MLTTVPALRDSRSVAATSLGSLRAVAAAAARVHTWAAAAEARRRTERALDPLRGTAWDVAHDIRLPGVDRIDHLAAGPSGVYLLASKAWHGVVTVDHKGATITPPREPGAAWTAYGPHRSLAPAASAVVRALSTATGRPFPPARAVVVVWAPFPEQVTLCAGIAYVAGDRLVEWLIEQPARSAPPRLGLPVRFGATGPPRLLRTGRPLR
jgi:hypothetical protein